MTTYQTSKLTGIFLCNNCEMPKAAKPRDVLSAFRTSRFFSLYSGIAVFCSEQPLKRCCTFRVATSLNCENTRFSGTKQPKPVHLEEV